MAYTKFQLTAPQVEDANGNPLVGGSISAYVWDTSTPLAMYTSSAGAGSATSFTFNSLGNPQTIGGTACDIFLDTAYAYKLIIRDSASTQVGPTLGPIYPGGVQGSVSFDSLEDVRASSTSHNYIETLSAIEGGNVGGAKLYNNGTTGTPTTAGNEFSALAAGTFFNASGVGYSLRADQSVTPYMLGALGDDSSDDTASVEFSISGGVIADLYEGVYVNHAITSTEPGGIRAVNVDAVLKNTTPDEGVLIFQDNGTDRPERPFVHGVRFLGSPTDTTDDYASLKFKGADYAQAIGNLFEEPYVGFAIDYGSATLGPYSGSPSGVGYEQQPERQSYSSVAAFNDVKNGAYMGFEVFASVFGRLIGNGVNNESDSGSHAYRVVGFPGMYSKYNVVLGNQGHNTLHGLSLQRASKANILDGFTFSSIGSVGFHQTLNSTDDADFTRLNRIGGIVDGCLYGAWLVNPMYNSINVQVDGATTRGVWLDADGGGYGSAKSNNLDAIVINSAYGASIEASHTIARVNLDECGTTGLRIQGDYNIVDVISDNPSQTSADNGLVIAGNFNIVRFIGTNNSNSIDVTVSGSDNILTLHTNKGLSVSGSRNRLIGTAGSLTVSGSNNNFSGMNGCGGGGVSSQTTDVNGRLTITLTPSVPSGRRLCPTVCVETTTETWYAEIYSVNSAGSSFVVRIRNDNGSPVASTAVTVVYNYVCV
jgi:hypothetical protein